ncbi:MAG TPA: DNA methyltransferase [Acidimicrobiales bacterium]|nr:DNA methyltransferase [Acidimicrobiales bacterium]
MRQRRPTSTSNFGVGRRESHDATAFYDRFQAPELSTDDEVPPPKPISDPFVCGDARSMDEIEDGSVALVVTSPPYFAGKHYEEELEKEGVPSSYIEYLELLSDVFAECARKLEPGGRIAVNVANLGRKPYRSLSSDVITILQDRLGLLLRGEIIWQKGEGASGSCAWGSFRSPANPVLRDLTERVVIASKGRFDRARSATRRRVEGLPHDVTLTTEDFMSLTLDVWEIAPESARRVGHPAPFPIELPEKLIALYTYADDLVLDPFMGSGSALVAAARMGRRYVGYDLDPAYVEITRRRVSTEGAPVDASVLADPVKGAKRIAEDALVEAGFTIMARNRRVRRTGVAVSFVAEDRAGHPWLFEVAGSATSHRGGLSRTDVVWRTVGRLAALRDHVVGPVVVLTPQLPRRGSEGDLALRAAGPLACFDAIDLRLDDAQARLATYAGGGHHTVPDVGFWTAQDLAPHLTS